MTKNTEQNPHIVAAWSAMATYGYTKGNEEQSIEEIATDLLTDLRHLLQQEGVDIERILRMAKLHQEAEQETKYNGWANYETWAVNLWLNNEETSYRYWNEQAACQIARASQRPQVLDSIWTPANAARYYLADQLRDELTDASPLEGGSVYSDLLTAAFSDVNWSEVAQAFMDGLSE